MKARTIALATAAIVVAASVGGYLVFGNRSADVPGQTVVMGDAPVEPTSDLPSVDTSGTEPRTATDSSSTASGDAAVAAAGATGSSGSSGTSTKPKTPAKVTLTLEQKKSCYWDIILANDRAVSEAEDKYPMEDEKTDINQHVEYRFELVDKYEAEVAAKYGISVEQLNSISEEGLKNAWPMPPLS